MIVNDFPDSGVPERGRFVTSSTGGLMTHCRWAERLLTFVNCWDVKWATRVQDVFTYGKLIALIVIIVTGFVELGKGKVEYFNFDNSETDITKIALNYLNFVIEELKEPHKNLPRAIFISCALVTVIYALTIVAFHTTLSIQEVMGAEAVAVIYADRLFGNFFAWVVPIFVALSLLLRSKRYTFHFIKALLSLVYLCSKDIYALINYVGFATWLAIGLAVVCLPYLRWKQPDLPRPIKVNLFFPIIYILATIFITIVPMIAEPVDTGFGVLIICTGVPVYFLFIYWENKPKCIKNAIESFTKNLTKATGCCSCRKTNRCLKILKKRYTSPCSVPVLLMFVSSWPCQTIMKFNSDQKDVFECPCIGIAEYVYSHFIRKFIYKCSDCDRPL
ncbi:large neutral amino acids transporter small subunit 2 [Caerostris extrusa]|uniref:Large neutral amino acids transporter small subunit 2 n=1 Tax=Caerostris extrusa TaxID=172846 RepID=A0AAV4QKJ2_CAEEX|nr:large neutral amino acids transporter small subunit 2 [Caerostris extrusa]